MINQSRPRYGNQTEDEEVEYQSCGDADLEPANTPYSAIGTRKENNRCQKPAMVQRLNSQVDYDGKQNIYTKSLRSDLDGSSQVVLYDSSLECKTS